MFCFHKYKEIKNGFQFCEKCNKRIVAECKHEWEQTEAWELERNKHHYANSYIKRCKLCLEHHKEIIYIH